MNELERLLPCPFCGRPPSVIPDTSYGEARVMCFDDCPVQPIACAELADGATVQDAIAAWNTRADLSQRRPIEPVSYIDFQKKRGRLPDLIEEAIKIYDDFMKDDDYRTQYCLDRVINKLISARDWYNAPPETQP